MPSWPPSFSSASLSVPTRSLGYSFWPSCSRTLSSTTAGTSASVNVSTSMLSNEDCGKIDKEQKIKRNIELNFAVVCLLLKLEQPLLRSRCILWLFCSLPACVLLKNPRNVLIRVQSLRERQGAKLSRVGSQLLQTLHHSFKSAGRIMASIAILLCLKESADYYHETSSIGYFCSVFYSTNHSTKFAFH